MATTSKEALKPGKKPSADYGDVPHGHRDHNDTGEDGQDASDDSEAERLAHIEIERRRFRGGLPATPELYALAQEQWLRLPGALTTSPMDTVAGNLNANEQTAPVPKHDGELGGGQ